jgi:hypothetical protein
MSQPEDWNQQWQAFWDTTARVTEAWVNQALDTTLDVADAWADEVEKQVGPTLETWAEHIHATLEPLEATLDAEAERMADEFAEQLTPVVVPLVESLETWFEALSTPINQTVDPVVNDHPACVGCRHYYGQAHGGNMLVCAMYPYGPMDRQCPDWASTWSSSQDEDSRG